MYFCLKPLCLSVFIKRSKGEISLVMEYLTLPLEYKPAIFKGLRKIIHVQLKS